MSLALRPEVAPRAAPRLRTAREPAALHHLGHASRRRTIARPRLIEALRRDVRPVAVLAAPAGYGKTTLLAQLCAQDPRPFAWIALTSADDDPRRLADLLATRLGELGPLRAVPRTTRVAALTRAVSQLRPALLVLDDAHVLRSDGARDIVAAVARAVPPGTTLAIASRREPGLPLGRLRAQDDVVELGPDALAMTRAEAAELLRRVEPRLTARHVDRVHELTAGWPAALRLAARAVGEQDDAAAAVDRLAGDDGVVFDYVAEEVLAQLTSKDRRFLTRAAILDTLDGPRCDVVLGRRDSAERLSTLARETMLLAPLDRAATTHGLNALLRQALLRELWGTDPHAIPALHRRASTWYEHGGDLDRAVEHALAAGDADRVRDLVAERAPALVAAGRAPTLERWLDRLGDTALAQRPALAVARALAFVAAGDRDAGERWADAAAGPAPGRASAHRIPARRAPAHAARKPTASHAAGVGVVRAAVARDGAEAMTRDAADARAVSADAGPWRAFACLLEGFGHCLVGRHVEGRARLDEGARRAVVDAPLVRSLCLAQLAFLALDAGEDDDAAGLVAGARTALARAVADDAPLAALPYAVSSLVAAARGDFDAASRDGEQAARRLAAAPDLPPWYGATVRVVLARAQLRLSDAHEARRLLGEASRLERHVAGAAALRAWIDDAWARADDYAAGPVACPSALTHAELRVLRLLPSHLTFREIAARLHVSSNTVKTQAHAVYRKLDASSRSQAVAHARAIGLVDA